MFDADRQFTQPLARRAESRVGERRGGLALQELHEADVL